MKVLLYIYLGISVLTFILFTLTVVKISKEFKRRYPNIKAPKSPLVDHLLTYLKVLLLCFLPIANVAFFLLYLFCSEKTEERIIEKVYSKLSKEATDDE
jgi:hypothetical protein